MRISDWSSDLCSSDLGTRTKPASVVSLNSMMVMKSWIDRMKKASTTTSQANTSTRIVTALSKKVVKPDRKRVVKGKSVSVRVDLGGRRIIKKKNKERKRNKNITVTTVTEP